MGGKKYWIFLSYKGQSTIASYGTPIPRYRYLPSCSTIANCGILSGVQVFTGISVSGVVMISQNFWQQNHANSNVVIRANHWLSGQEALASCPRSDHNPTIQRDSYDNSWIVFDHSSSVCRVPFSHVSITCTVVLCRSRDVGRHRGVGAQRYPFKRHIGHKCRTFRRFDSSRMESSHDSTKSQGRTWHTACEMAAGLRHVNLIRKDSLQRDIRELKFDCWVCILFLIRLFSNSTSNLQTFVHSSPCSLKLFQTCILANPCIPNGKPDLFPSLWWEDCFFDRGNALLYVAWCSCLSWVFSILIYWKKTVGIGGVY